MAGRRTRPPTLAGPPGRRFAWYFTAVGVSGLGDGVRLTALPLLTATLTRSPLSVALVAAAQGLPWLLFSLPAGALVDRWDRRRTVVVANSARAALAGALAGVVGTGHASVLLLAGVAFGLTTGETFADAAARAVLPELVAPEQLEAANGRLYAAETASVQMVGPPLGSVLFTLRQAVPFVVDAASFAASAACFTRLRTPRPAARPEAGHASLWREMREAVQWLAGHRVLRALALPLLVMNLASEAVFAIFVLFALQDLHVGKSFYGLLFVCYAFGALLGSAGAARLRDGFGDGPAVVGAIVLFGAPFLVLGVSSNGYVGAGAMLVMGAGEAVWGVLTMSLRQAVIPGRLLGRVLNVFRLAGWGSLSVGAVIGGGVAHVFGLRAPVMAAGCLILVSAAVAGPALTTRRIRAARALASAGTDGGH